MILVLVLSAGLTASTAEPMESVAVRAPEGAHPHVFLTLEEADAVRARAERHEWAKRIRDTCVKEAEALVAAPLDIPHKGGQWSHWYTCKKDGAALKAKSPTEHVCPKCGEVYTGWPYDEVYVRKRHGHWFSAVKTLGIAHLFEAKPAYAERARAILLEYASFYQDLNLHNTRNRDGRSGARLAAQTLDEATSLCVLAVGYDLLHDAPCFTAEDHKAIEEGLLRPMVETIRRHRAGLSNWQSWHNGAIASVGFLLADEVLVDLAVNDPEHGFLRQMREAVLDNGMWFEGAPSYHFYALSAHTYLLEAAHRAGMDLYALPEVRSMFDGPLRQLLPDRTFPGVNDSDRSSISSRRECYEVAYRRYGDARYAALLPRRESDWALLWGVDDAPKAEARLDLASYNAESQGVAILRGHDGQTAVFFDYMRGGAGHMHPCRLNVILFAHDDERLVDPGRIAYGNPMQKGWFRQTIAHNTVVVNEKEQRNGPAALDTFATGQGWSLVRATCTEAYKRVVLDRAVLLGEKVVVDVFRCRAEQDSVFDLPLHFRGTLADLPASEPMASAFESPGYSVLKEVRELTEPLSKFSVGTGEDRRIHVQVLDESEAFTALGYAKKMQELLPVVVRRQRGPQADFVTVLELLDAGESPGHAECTTGDEVVVRLDGLELSVGEKTVVTTGGESHVL